MGCDIHIRAEVKKGKNWQAVGPVFKSSWSSEEGKLISEPYSSRNYELFSFLAGVRNRFGITPIAEPKGWPKDMSEELKKDLEDDWNSDGHSASWFTLKELEDADWDTTVRHGGVVPADVYEYLKYVKEKPKAYSQGISGTNIVQLDQAEWDALPWQQKTNGTRYHVYMWWEDSMKELAEWFYTNTLPALRNLGEPDKVRIVFCFDN